MQRISDMLGKVIDSYQILEVLGKGGMGVVYKALDTSLDKIVALKVMNPLLVEDERFLGRFKSEAKALGRLHHPHIVSIFALRHVEPHFFIVMEYVEGDTLGDRIKRHGAMAWQDALPIIEHTLKAIDYAHREKIIHRDVKPHNILVSRDGIAKMTDFGLAKIQAVHSDTRALTRTGFTGGTLYYMPPEQLEGLLHVDHRGDIYGLGMTYYEMLAGRTPFNKMSSEFAILKAIDAHDFPSLDAFNEAIPEPLVRIVMKAIEREPDDRYSSAGDMLRAIEAWQADSKPDAASEERVAMPAPSALEVPATPQPAKSEEGGSKVLMSLKAALAKGTQRFSNKESDSVEKTVIKKASSKAKTPRRVSSKAPRTSSPRAPLREPASTPSQSLKPSSGEKKDRDPETPKPAPVAPSPQPAPSPASEAIPFLERRRVRVIGGVGMFVLLAVLLYFGTQRLFQPASVTEDATATAETVLFSLRTLPDTAAVFIEGQRVGSTPLIDYEISAGTTSVRLEKPGYVALDTSITLGINLDATFTFSLLEDPEDEADIPDDQPSAVGTLTINSEPTGADVLLDGQNVGQTPLTVPDLETGSYRLVFRKQGFQEHSRSITVAPGAGNRATATLTSVVTATLTITLSPFGDIYIDGILKAQGTQEPYTEAFGAGVYRVQARHPQFGTWNKQVTIDSNDPQDIVFNFNQQFEVRVTSEPNRAQILVDGEPVGKRTPAVIRMRPGQRTIAVRRRGYLMEGAARVITLERDWTDEPLHFPLRQIQ